MDYVFSHSRVILVNVPISIDVTLQSDGVAGEEPETITLTLVPARELELNEVLANEAITIVLQDNDSKYLEKLIANLLM